MKKIIQVLSLVTVFAMGFSFISSNSASAATPKKAYVAAETTYSGGGNSSTSHGIDLYMGPKDAAIYASNLNTSYKSAIAWAGAGFIPNIGPYISIAGLASTVESQRLAKQITALSEKDKKVHIYKCGGITSVKEWKGKESSIVTSNPKSNTQTYGGITTYTKTKITKKVVKY